MADVGDRKYILNAEMLGQMVIGDANGEFVSIKAVDGAGPVDTQLSAGINGANIIAAINSAYAAAGGGPAGQRYAIQINSPDGTFSGSNESLFLAQETAGAMVVTHEGTYNLTGDLDAVGSLSASANVQGNVAAFDQLTSAQSALGVATGTSLTATGDIKSSAGSLSASANVQGNIAAFDRLTSAISGLGVATGTSLTATGDIKSSAGSLSASANVQGNVAAFDQLTSAQSALGAATAGTVSVTGLISGSGEAMVVGGYKMIGTNESGVDRVYHLTVEGGILLATDAGAPA